MSGCMKSPWLDLKIPVDSDKKLLASAATEFCTQRAKILRVKFETDPSSLHMQDFGGDGGGWGLVGLLVGWLVIWKFYSKESGGRTDRKSVV